LPGLTRQSILLVRRKMDARVMPAYDERKGRARWK
jgi:hypothetical protein